MRLLSSALLLASLVFLPVPRVAATTQRNDTVSTTAHGIRLTLSVPRRLHVRDALVRFTVTVSNVSDHPVATRLGPMCIDTNPTIQVLDRHGTPVSQLPPNSFLPRCERVTMQLLSPGRTVTTQEFAVLNGVAARAVLKVGHSLGTAVRTPAVRIGVAAGRALFLFMYPSISGPHAVVERPMGARGPLYVRDSTYCGAYTGMATSTAELRWHPVKGNRVATGCLGPQSWHGFVGYENFPVGTIRYTTR